MVRATSGGVRGPWCGVYPKFTEQGPDGFRQGMDVGNSGSRATWGHCSHLQQSALTVASTLPQGGTGNERSGLIWDIIWK